MVKKRRCGRWLDCLCCNAQCAQALNEKGRREQMPLSRPVCILRSARGALSRPKVTLARMAKAVLFSPTLKVKACPASPALAHHATGPAWPGGPMQIAAPVLLQSGRPHEKAWRACHPQRSKRHPHLARQRRPLTVQTGWPDWLAAPLARLSHPAAAQQPPDQGAPVHSPRSVQGPAQEAGPASASPSKPRWLQPVPRPPRLARARSICFVKVPSCADYDGSEPSSTPCF